MVTLIIPAARDGPAFLNKKPAWLAQLPQGQLALQQILAELDCSKVTRIVFVTLSAHIDKYCGGDSENLSRLIRETLAMKTTNEDLLIQRYTGGKGNAGRAANTTAHFDVNVSSSNLTSPLTNNHMNTTADAAHNKGPNTFSVPSVTIVALESSPQSAPETVCIAVESAHITGPIFVKDSDGSFVHRIEEGDYVCGLCLGDVASGGSSSGSALAAQSTHDLLSKSFIERTGVLLTNLVEKKLVSDTIAVGGYGFRSATDFVTAAQKAEQIKRKITHALTAEASNSTRVFVSNVVQQMLFENVAFSVSLTKCGLSDWKTEASWNNYIATFRNIIVALEGELFIPPETDNALAAALDIASYVAKDDRIDRLVDLKMTHGSRCTIVISSREPVMRDAVVRNLLDAHGVPFDALIMGVPSAPTTLLQSRNNCAAIVGGTW